MANKNLFSSQRNAGPATTTTNEAGGVAYKFEDEHALAQMAVTGTFNDTFYAKAEEQAQILMDLCQKVTTKFIAQTAIYSRKNGHMKDMPAFLCAYLSSKNPLLLKRIFNEVIDNSKMLRNFVQIVRSGAVGRKSFGTSPKTMIKEWLNSHDDDYIFRGSVGKSPSMADIIKMVHPKPETKSREALYGYMIGRKYNKRNLPKLVKEFEKWKSDGGDELPKVPFEMLTALELDTRAWTQIAKNAGWQMLRMNLNTFTRHSVFEDKKMVKYVADRLRDEEEISKARVFPYQLLMAYTTYEGEHEIKEALQDALDISIKNVPEISGRIALFPDVSGSMGSPVTGHRAGATTAVRCIDVAGLMASIFMHMNKNALVLPFECDVVNVNLNPRDSVVTNAKKLASVGGGGTCCGAPMKLIAARKEKVDLVIYISDNESWVSTDSHVPRPFYNNYATDTMAYWKEVKKVNPKAKMVCIDLQQYGSTQAVGNDILNIGGFSDSIFETISRFVEGKKQTADLWVEEIKKIEV